MAHLKHGTSSHLLSANGHLVADCDCCGGDLCFCPQPAPTSLIITGHIRCVDGLGNVICDSDFTNILSVTDSLNCRYDNGQDQGLLVCSPLLVAITLQWNNPVSWLLTLAFAGGGFENPGQTSRPCPSGFIGSYPNVGSSPGCTYTGIVIS